MTQSLCNIWSAMPSPHSKLPDKETGKINENSEEKNSQEKQAYRWSMY